VYLRYVSSLQFLTYLAFFAIFVGSISYMLPGRKPPLRTEPYTDDELGAHDRKLAKYFVAGAFFLVLGSVHMVVKNVPALAEALARMGYGGHLVRDLSSTHVMIVGGGTLLATGLTWRVLPRIVGRPLASEGLAQAAFWLTALGLGSSTCPWWRTGSRSEGSWSTAGSTRPQRRIWASSTRSRPASVPGSWASATGASRRTSA
jgi:hypothetical protein